MSVAEWKGEVEVKETTCDLERHTFFCLEMEIWIERMRGEGREVERRGREALRIFYYRWACCQPFGREGGNRCSFECFCFYFAFPRDGHKMVLYPNQVTRVFAAAAACFFLCILIRREWFFTHVCVVRELSC
jgi:hypothetical protein